MLRVIYTYPQAKYYSFQIVSRSLFTRVLSGYIYEGATFNKYLFTYMDKTKLTSIGLSQI